MKNNETRWIIGGLILATVLGIAVFCVFTTADKINLMYSDRSSDKKIDISGNFVENDYNNGLFLPQFVRIDNKLYFNHFKDDYDYGVYEISQAGSKRIFWKGPRWLGAQYHVPALRLFDAHLMMYDRETEVMYEYDESNLVRESICFKENIADEYINESFQKTKYGIIYEKRDDVSSCYALALKNETRSSILVESKDGFDIHGFYYWEDKLYYEVRYQNKDPKLCKNHIRVYNFKDNTDVLIYDFGLIECNEFLIEKGVLIFNTPDGDSCYMIDLNQTDLEAKKIFGNTRNCTFNAFNGKIYICSAKGITAYDLTTQQTLTLLDSSAKGCYIVDDRWIYFVETHNDAALWRIPQAGGKAEKVFG